MKVMIIEASLFANMPEKELKKELNRLKEQHGYHFIVYQPIFIPAALRDDNTLQSKWDIEEIKILRKFNMQPNEIKKAVLEKSKIRHQSIEEIQLLASTSGNLLSVLSRIESKIETSVFQRNTKKIVFSALILSAGITGALLAQFNVISASMITSLLSASLVINPALWPLFAGLGMAGAAAMLFFVGLGLVYCCRCCCAKSEKDISPEDENTPEAQGLLSGETPNDIPLSVIHPAPNATLYSDPHLLAGANKGSSEAKRDERVTVTASTSDATQSAQSVVDDISDTESHGEEENNTDRTETETRETTLTF